jgi:hypothetical protein
MNAATTYALPGFTGLLTHGWRKPKLVKDEAVPSRELEAQVRSGDYFVALATELDQLSRDATDYEVKIKLENIVSDLIHLQDHYTITKNEQAE